MKNKLLFLLIILLAVLSCSANDDFESERPKDDIEDPKQGAEKENQRKLNILVIGNSLARDAFSYVPPIIEDICPDISVALNILYVSGQPLATHCWYMSNGMTNFIVDAFLPYSQKWKSVSNYGADEVLSLAKWDLVILQEGSVNARTYEATQPSVEYIVDYVRSYYPDVPVAYTIIPSLADGYSALGNLSSDEVWKMNAETARMLVEQGNVDYLIPCGTGIQNARHTSLNSFGNFGHLSYDGRHLQEGIPCVVDAYTAVLSILNVLSIDAPIDNSTIRVTQDWVNAINVPGRHGNVLEGTESDYELARECALLANEQLFEICIP